MTEDLKKTLDCFALDSRAANCEPYGNGHINATFLVKTESGKRYVLQRINDRTFPDVDGLMENIVRVTEHLRERSDDPRTVLTLVPTKSGKYWTQNGTGCWRVYDYIEDSLCLQLPESPDDFYESAIGIGRFLEKLEGFPAQQLHEVIPNFHNTPDRYRIFHEILEKDPMGRAASVGDEISFYLKREDEMSTLQQLLKSGQLPLRVTHNDTKLNNVLLDIKTRKALCIIDLDTVMPGLSLYDFGDSVRFGAATAAEDEQDLDKVSVSLDLFRIFTRGFINACPGLTEKELEMLPMGAKTMTLECGLRFLTDYLDGDHYFSVRRDGQNLDRTRTQMKLVLDMESKWQELNKIVAEEVVVNAGSVHI